MSDNSELAEPNDPPIIITGGSVNLDFDPSTLPGASGRHSNAGKKIRHVTVVIGNNTIYDQDVPNGRVEITVTYGNPRP